MRVRITVDFWANLADHASNLDDVFVAVDAPENMEVQNYKGRIIGVFEPIYTTVSVETDPLEDSEAAGNVEG